MPCRSRRATSSTCATSNQALENFKRVPTAEADIQITPAEGDGAAPGESDLRIAWQQRFPLRLNLSLDDAGYKSTGKYQSAVTVSADHALTLNDLFYVSLNQSLGTNQGEKGTRGYTIHYALPFGYWGLGLTTSRSTYHQTVAGLNAPVRYRGTTENSDIKLSRIVYRDAERKIGLSAARLATALRTTTPTTKRSSSSVAAWRVGKRGSATRNSLGKPRWTAT